MAYLSGEGRAVKMSNHAHTNPLNTIVFTHFDNQLATILVHPGKSFGIS